MKAAVTPDHGGRTGWCWRACCAWWHGDLHTAGSCKQEACRMVILLPLLLLLLLLCQRHAEWTAGAACTELHTAAARRHGRAVAAGLHRPRGSQPPAALPPRCCCCCCCCCCCSCLLSLRGCSSGSCCFPPPWLPQSLKRLGGTRRRGTRRYRTSILAMLHARGMRSCFPPAC